MATYQAESFYRGTIRQSIANNTSVPFTLKVSKIPSLTAGLLTVSPNTANEEIIEYSGVDGTALTITVVKRGINPSTQVLTTSGTDYNNVTFQKEHSQNDVIRGDVNHLHIIQDYGSLSTNKLDKAGGLRTTMLTVQDIGATNGSPNITVADTTGWENGATITGTGIPGGTTILSFVANTSAILSANFTGTTGTVSATVGYKQLSEYDATGLEVKRPISVGASILSTDLFQKINPSTRAREEVAYSQILADMSIAGGGAFSISPYEASIALGNPVGMTSDGLIKCTTENKSSANISASSINIVGQTSLDSTRTFFLYAVGLAVYARVGTLSGDVMTYGTEVSLGTLGTGGVRGGCTYLDTDKVVCVYWDDATAGAVARHRICTISGTTISQGTEVTQGMTAISPKAFVGLCKVRANAYAWGNWDTNTYYFYIFTVSGTTITPNGTSFLANTTGQFPPNFAYLSDNVIAVGGAGNGTQMIMYLLEVNPGGTTITTTHTYGTGITSGSNWRLCRTGNNEYVFGYDTTTVAKLAKAVSGVVLVYTSLVTAPAVSLPLCQVGPNHFAIINGTSVLIYSRNGELIGTILGISSPVSNGLFAFIDFRLGRWIYINGTNGTSRIINFAKVFYFGIANNATGGVIKRGTITISGIVMNVKYYLQSDGTITDIISDRYVGIGIGTNTLLIG